MCGWLQTHHTKPVLPAKHSELLLRAIDLASLMQTNRDSTGAVMYTAMLPAVAVTPPHNALLSVVPATPDHTLLLLQEVLRHAVKKGALVTAGLWRRATVH